MIELPQFARTAQTGAVHFAQRSQQRSSPLKIEDLLGVNIQNTIAVGDYNNDVLMLKAAVMFFALI